MGCALFGPRAGDQIRQPFAQGLVCGGQGLAQSGEQTGQGRVRFPQEAVPPLLGPMEARGIRLMTGGAGGKGFPDGVGVPPGPLCGRAGRGLRACPG